MNSGGIIVKFKQNKRDKHIDSPDDQKRSWPRLIFKSIKNLFLFFLVFCFIAGFFVLGFGSGYFASLFKDEPIRDYETMKKDIKDYEKTSKLYFAGDQFFVDIFSHILCLFLFLFIIFLLCWFLLALLFFMLFRFT